MKAGTAERAIQPGRVQTLRWFKDDARALTCARVVRWAVAVLAVQWVACAPAARADGDDVSVEVTEASGVYHVHGTFTVGASVEEAWEVLADYEHIGAFVKSIRTSEFVAGPGGQRVLRQDASVGVFPFRRTVRVELLLDVDEQRRIAFRDVLGRDFKHYAGAWTLGIAPWGAVTVDYALDADPAAGVPAMIGRGAMARSARDLLTQVRAEMGRRGGEERERED